MSDICSGHLLEVIGEVNYCVGHLSFFLSFSGYNSVSICPITSIAANVNSTGTRHNVSSMLFA